MQNALISLERGMIIKMLHNFNKFVPPLLTFFCPRFSCWQFCLCWHSPNPTVIIYPSPKARLRPSCCLTTDILQVCHKESEANGTTNFLLQEKRNSSFNFLWKATGLTDFKNSWGTQHELQPTSHSSYQNVFPVKHIDVLLGWGTLSHDEFSEADTYWTWATTQVLSSESGSNSQ